MSAAFIFYKERVFLIGRLFRPDSATRIFFDASASALGTKLILLALYSVLNTVPEDLPLLEPIHHITKLLLIISLLRCYVREGMIRFIQQNYPGYLPQHRAQLTKAPEAGEDHPGFSVDKPNF